MKRKGSKSDYTAERNKELRAAFFSQETYSTGDEQMKKLIRTPASRFWVDPEHARDVISRVKKDPEALGRMKPERERMYRALMSRYDEIQRRNPRQSKLRCVSAAIYAGAPEFYIAPSTAREIIYAKR